MSFKAALIKHVTPTVRLLRINFKVLFYLYLLFNAIFSEAHVVKNGNDESKSTGQSSSENGSIPCSFEENNKSKCLNGGECIKPSIDLALFLCRCSNEFEGEQCESKVLATWQKFMANRFYQFLIISFLALIVFLTILFVYCALKRYRRGYTPWKDESG